MSCLRFNFKHLVAVTGEDFEAPSPTVELPQTLNDDVSIIVGILDDNILEGDHSFTLCVMEVLDQSGPYTIRVEDSSGCDTVTITDEDDGKSTFTIHKTSTVCCCMEASFLLVMMLLLLFFFLASATSISFVAAPTLEFHEDDSGSRTISVTLTPPTGGVSTGFDIPVAFSFSGTAGMCC